MRKSLLACAIASLGFLGFRGASAASVFISFEDLTPGSVSSISETDPNLSGPVTFKTVDNSSIKVVNLSSVSGATDFGNASIQAGSSILIDFPSTVSTVSIEAGHNDGMSGSITLAAFDGASGAGTMLGSNTQNLFAVGTTFNTANLEVDQAGILSAELSFDSTQTVYFDNLGATTGSGTSAVPLPAAALSFPIGAAFAALAIRRMRRSQIA